MIKINIVNFSKVIGENEVLEYIKDLVYYLSDKGVDCSKLNVCNLNKELKKYIKSIIYKFNCDGPLLENIEFLMEINNYISEDNKLIIIDDENIQTKYIWGDAIDEIAIIKNINKYNIWHEVVHLLGAKDHYDINTKLPLEKCLEKDCIMRYGNLNGKMCDTSIQEIKDYLK